MSIEPVYPTPAVSAIILDSNRLLLARRAHEPGRGLWSLPGGRIEPGETVGEAVKREVLEETGLVVEPDRIAGVRDVIGRQNDSVAFHYVIISFFVRVVSGDPAAATDAAEVRWVRLADIGSYPLTEGLADWLASLGLIAPDQKPSTRPQSTP